MSLSEIPADSLAQAIANSETWEWMAYFLPLVRLLADGAPVSREQLATVLKRPVAEVAEALCQFEEIVYDEEGAWLARGSPCSQRRTTLRSMGIPCTPGAPSIP